MFPFYWMLSSALKPLPDHYATPIQWWPRNPTLQAFGEVLGLTAVEGHRRAAAG